MVLTTDRCRASSPFRFWMPEVEPVVKAQDELAPLGLDNRLHLRPDSNEKGEAAHRIRCRTAQKCLPCRRCKVSTIYRSPQAVPPAVGPRTRWPAPVPR